MKQLKTIILAVTLVTASSIAASAQSAPGGTTARDGNGTTTGTMQKPGTTGSLNGGAGMANPNPASPDVRGAGQTPSDPAAIGTSGRDKQTGATKDKD